MFKECEGKLWGVPRSQGVSISTPPPGIKGTLHSLMYMINVIKPPALFIQILELIRLSAYGLPRYDKWFDEQRAAAIV